MNQQELDKALKEMGVAPSHELDILCQRWSEAPDDLVKAVVGMLRGLSKLKNIELRPRLRNRVSGYGYNPHGIRHECFHIGILSRTPKVIIYQLGVENGLPSFFTKHQETRPNARYGYLHQGNLDLIASIQAVLQQSFRNLTEQ